MDYKEQIKTQEWKVKRTEIIARDKLQCQCCFDEKTQLNVHHKKYIKGLMAWEYEDKDMITFCNDCHNLVHEFENYTCVDFACKVLEITPADLFILKFRCERLKVQQNDRWIKTAIELLTAQIITKDSI